MNTFSKIKNVDFAESVGLMELNNLHIDQKEFGEIKEISLFAPALAEGLQCSRG